MKLNRFNRVQLTAVIAAAAFAAAACGSSSNTASSSPQSSPTPTPTKEAKFSDVKACDLVHADEASTAVGTAVQNNGGPQIGGLCFYTGTSADGTSAYVAVFGQVLTDSSTAQSTSPDQIAAAMNGAFGVSNAKVVSGIGDKAVEYTTTGPSNQSGVAIFVVKSNVVLMIAMAPSTDSGKIETLARTAVGRL